MKLSKEEVQNVANLARIELTQEEVEKFSNQLSEVLTYVEQLQGVNTEGIEETAQVTGLENVLREDKIETREEEIESAIAQAPEQAANMVKVKSVF